MRNSTLLVLITIFLILTAGLFWLLNADATIDNSAELSSPNNQAKNQAYDPSSADVATGMSLSVVEAPADEAVFTLASQIQDIATAYSQSAQYPRGSQPVLNPEQVIVFSAFEENATSFELDSNMHGQVQLSVATKQYQHFSGDDIEVLVSVGKVPRTASVDAIAILSDINGDALFTLDLDTGFKQSWELRGAINGSDLAELDLPPELQIAATVEVDGEVFFSSAALKYNDPSATIVGLGNANPNAEYLDLPLKIDVHDAGYYFLSAVLFDANGKAPLVQLQEEARLRVGDQEIVLKAHIQALKVSANEGPYMLKHFSLRRGAEDGELYDSAGNSAIEALHIEAFSFERYEDKAYVDPLAQEREAFLRRLSSVSGN
ncbi:hypothetical protein PN836_019045 [Ningiella sp. W23]|uniref:DUF4785 family immunoglobulin-like domain-containing protein n=1 Tax=Ningiella sp. W23 TaxID=3023715 RepID=UPI00375654D1